MVEIWVIFLHCINILGSLYPVNQLFLFCQAHIFRTFHRTYSVMKIVENTAV